jgi:hypothetical protein
LTFESLVISIRGIDQDLSAQAGRAVNISVTLRNWLIGWHIEEYERRGVDRAQYGEKLMGRLADELTLQGVSRCDRRELYRYRTFYETECIRGNWAVRELKRQIASLYFERAGLSRDKTKLAKLAQANAEPAEPRLAIRDPYIFEFLGLQPREVMSESHLADQLLDKLPLQRGRN